MEAASPPPTHRLTLLMSTGEPAQLHPRQLPAVSKTGVGGARQAWAARAHVHVSPPLRAMSSSAAKEQFLRQMEQIVEGIKQSRIKVQTPPHADPQPPDLHTHSVFSQLEKKKQENKMRRDQLNDQYLELLDKQRLYFKTVKDFKEVRRPEAGGSAHALAATHAPLFARRSVGKTRCCCPS